MKRHALVILVLAAMALGLAFSGVLWWQRHMADATFFTDADLIRAPAATAPLRDILWQPARPVAALDALGEDDYEPRFDAEERALYFVRGRAGEDADIYVSTRTLEGWTDPVPVPALNTDYEELGPEPSRDGQSLYFYSDRPGGLGGFDLWVARRDGDDWTEPVNLGSRINSPHNDYGPAVAPDGLSLVFSSNRPKPGEQIEQENWPATIREDITRRDYDLFGAPFTAQGLGEAQRLAALNTNANEGAPAFSPVGDYLYFGSDRAGGLGGFDIYRARRLRGDLTPPENLGPAVNSRYNDLDPALSMGGFSLHFSSDRASYADGESRERPVYDLYVSTSREVFREVDPALAGVNWGELWSKLWPLLLLLALLLLLLLLLLRFARDQSLKDRFRKLSLLAKCLLLSVLAHMLLLALLAIWQVGNSLGDYLRGSNERQVALITRSAGDTVTRQVRGTLTDMAMPLPLVASTQMPEVDRVEIEQPDAALDAARATVRDQSLNEQPDPSEAQAAREPPSTPQQVATQTPDVTPTLESQREARTDEARIEQAAQQAEAPSTSQPEFTPEVATDAPAQLTPEQRAMAERIDVLTDAPALAESRPVAQPQTSRQLDAQSPDMPMQALAEPERHRAREAQVEVQPTEQARPDAPRVHAIEPSAALAQVQPNTTDAAIVEPVQVDAPARDATGIRAEITPSQAQSLAQADLEIQDNVPHAAPARAAEAELRVDADASQMPQLAAIDIETADAATQRADIAPTAQSSEPTDALDLGLLTQDAQSTQQPASPTLTDAAPPTDLAAMPDARAEAVQEQADALPERTPTPTRILGTIAVDAAPMQVDAIDPIPMSDHGVLTLETPLTDTATPSSAPTQAQPTLDQPTQDIALALPNVESSEQTPEALAAQPTATGVLDPLVSAAAPELLETETDTAPVALEAAASASTDALDIEVETNDASTNSQPTLDLPTLVLTPDLELDLPLPSVDEPPVENPLAQRAPDVREQLVEEHGGSQETEQAVALALEWFISRQSPDGRWTGAGPRDARPRMEDPARYDFDAAMTGLAMLCFLGANHTHADEGPYRENLERAVQWLLDRQSANGDLRGEETMYSHAIASIALCESLAMTGDPRLRDPAERAIDFIVRARNTTVGGWRYDPGQAGDTSVLGWQIMALKSAQRAGIDVPEDAFQAAADWLDVVSEPGRRGLYAYRPGQHPTHPMTAEGMFVQQLIGADRESPRMRQSATAVMERMPAWNRNANTYAWYYATLALFQHQGDAWRQWNEALVDELLDNQRMNGPERGSWDPGDRWSRIGGRIYQTALCTLSLEVYYRYLPQYIDDPADDNP